MRGHVSSYQIKAGKRWRIIYDGPPDPETGKRRQKQQRGFATKRDAERALRKAMGRVDDGTHVDPSDGTVAEYLLSWVTGLRKRANTVARYRTAIEAYMIPRIGHLRLQQTHGRTTRRDVPRPRGWRWAPRAAAQPYDGAPRPQHPAQGPR